MSAYSACGVSPGIFPVLAEEAAQQWTARFNPRPVTEADLLHLYEAALYYMGRPVYYGTTTYGPGSVASSRNPSNLANYQSPLVADCQKSFIVYLTDGEPTFDVDADAKIKSLVDAKGQTFASLNGGSATCDVEVYPPGFTPSGG